MWVLKSGILALVTLEGNGGEGFGLFEAFGATEITSDLGSPCAAVNVEPKVESFLRSDAKLASILGDRDTPP